MTGRPGSLRRGFALGIAAMGLVVIVGGVVLAGIGSSGAVAERKSESEQLADTLSTAAENLPTVGTVDPAVLASIDFSRTPPRWFDARTDPASIVVPPSNAEHLDIWSTQRALTAKCMAEHGFWYAWTFTEGDGVGGIGVLSDAAYEADGRPNAAKVALEGDWVGTYRWQDAGCEGAAVHLTGMDDAN